MTRGESTFTRIGYGYGVLVIVGLLVVVGMESGGAMALVTIGQRGFRVGGGGDDGFFEGCIIVIVIIADNIHSMVVLLLLLGVMGGWRGR